MQKSTRGKKPAATGYKTSRKGTGPTTRINEPLDAVRVDRFVSRPTVPTFSPEAPPADWEQQHQTAHAMTVLHRNTGRTAYHDPLNRVVPRTASCHFYGVRDAARSNIYFY